MTSAIESQPAFPGMEGSIEGARITLLNASNEVAQRNQITVGTVVANTDYTVIIDNRNITYRSSATDTATSIGSQLRQEINLAGLGVTATSDATTGDLTLTGTPGKPFDLIITGGDAGYVASQSATAAKSAPVKFGRVVVHEIADDLGVGRLPSNNSQAVRGISMHTHKGQKFMTGGACYKHGEPMAVKIGGSIWVNFEGVPDITLPINYRFAATGDFTELGTLTSTLDGGTAQLPNAKFLAIEGTLAEILINYA